MGEIPVCRLVNELNTSYNISSLLLGRNYIYLGTDDGTIVVYEVQENDELIKKTEIPRISNAPIDSMKEIEDNFIVLASGLVSIYDNTAFGLQETLPFKQVTHLTSFKTSTNSYIALSTKFMIIVYIWTHEQFEEIRQHKSQDKIVSFQFINEESIIAASNSQFYLFSSTNPHEPTKIPFHSQFSFFNQRTSIIPNGEIVLLAKGAHASKWNKNSSDEVQSIHWDSTSQFIEFLSPFIVFFSGNHVKFLDFKNLKTYQTLEIPKVSHFATQKEHLVITSKNSIYLYKLLSFDDITNYLEKHNLQQAIDFVNQLDLKLYPEQPLKLRTLEIENAISLFHSAKYAIAIRKFSEFVAPPIKVINLYPSYISGSKPKKQTNKDENGEEKELDQEEKIDQKAVQLLVHYLSDIRRKFNKVISSENGELEYLNSKLTVSSFTENEHSVGEVRRAVDSALFRCYDEINSGLIGSLVRVDNYCDTDLVVETFKSKNMINELIDFYNKKGLHEQALELLVDLCKDSRTPDPVVKYVQNLKSEHLDLILKYSDWPISIMESYGIEIFLNSQYAETFNRQKIAKYLGTKSQNLERIYLEFIIIELRDKAKAFHTRLVEIYFDELKKDHYRLDSIFYKKLYTFLQLGNYDAPRALEIAPSESSHLKLLQTFILKKLQRHEQALSILVGEINDSNLAIHYVQDLFEEDFTVGHKFFLKLVHLFSERKDKVSILKLLETSKDSNIPIVDILNTLPSEFKVFDIEQVLIKSLRLQRKLNSSSTLTRNLRSIQSVKIEEKLLDLQNQRVEVVSKKTRCPVCSSYLAGSVLSRYPNGDVIHFGCAKVYQRKIDENTRVHRLKTVKLKDYKLA